MTKKEIIKKGDVNYMKKTLSLFLAVLMILATMPVAFAAEPIQLSEANVVEWPTISGNMFYGQTLAEGDITIEGGKVTLDGTAEGAVIDGAFEFVDTSARPVVGGTAQVKFVPADTEAYTVIETEVAVTVNQTTAIYGELPTASKAAAVGKRLSTVTLTSQPLINPYTGEEIPNSKWNWSKRTTKVESPGLYEVTATYGTLATNYTTIKAFVWVSIEGVDDTLMPTIKEYPTFKETLSYNPNLTWGELTLEGGKAVIYDADNNEIEVEGTFSVADVYKNVALKKIGEQTIAIQFTSADETIASSIPFSMIITVEKGIPAWTSGETLVLNYDYGATPFGQYGNKIDELDARNLNCYDEQHNPYSGYNFMLYNADNEPLNFGYYYKPDVGTYNYYVKVSGVSRRSFHQASLHFEVR